jgi:hypothetical protein
VRIDLTYLNGTLPEDEREALRGALRSSTPGVSVSVVPQPRDVVVVTATVRADHSLDAIADVSSRVDRALLGTGLFEAFDATGRGLRVARNGRLRPSWSLLTGTCGPKRGHPASKLPGGKRMTREAND